MFSLLWLFEEFPLTSCSIFLKSLIWQFALRFYRSQAVPGGSSGSPTLGSNAAAFPEGDRSGVWWPKDVQDVAASSGPVATTVTQRRESRDSPRSEGGLGRGVPDAEGGLGTCRRFLTGQP